MIEEVKDFFGDVREGVGDKGFIVLIIGVIGIFVYNLLKSDTSDGEVYYTPTAVSGYPSVERNADVVIDSVNKTIEGVQAEMTEDIFGYITDAKDEVNDNMSDGFVAIGDYINEGLTKVENLSNKIDNIDTRPNVSYSYTTNHEAGSIYVDASGENNNSTITQLIASAVNKGTNADDLGATKGSDTTVTATVTDKSKTVTGTNTANSNYNSNGDGVKYYSYKTKAGLNTNTSIVDALKAGGYESSMSYRKDIATANGIKNYTGSYSQNVDMLNKMKAGTLIIPTMTTEKAKSLVDDYASKMGWK